jgi:ATP-dependent Lon protease
LSDIVIFPGTGHAVAGRNAQSIRLIDDVVAGDRFLGLVLQRNARKSKTRSRPILYSFGCAGRVLKMLKFPDGTVRVAGGGVAPLSHPHYASQTPYLMARIENSRTWPTIRWS